MAYDFQDPALITSFGLVADSLYPDHRPELVDAELLIEEHEAEINYPVTDFEGFKAATEGDNEALFVRWQTVRRLSEERLHVRRRGFT